MKRQLFVVWMMVCILIRSGMCGRSDNYGAGRQTRCRDQSDDVGDIL